MGKLAKQMIADAYAREQRRKKIIAGWYGQRYEVRAFRPKDDVPSWYTPQRESIPSEEFVVGWSEQPDGGGLMSKVLNHPTWIGGKIVDLGEEEWERDPAKGLY